MKRRIILDTGPLVALLNRRDRHHAWAATLWREIEAPLLTCESVLAESCHLLRDVDGGPGAVVQLLERGAVTTGFAITDESGAVSRLIARYHEIGISLADACLVRMSELFSGSAVMTIDSDFKIYRRLGRRVIPTLMP